jgi:hypothetical protein
MGKLWKSVWKLALALCLLQSSHAAAADEDPQDGSITHISFDPDQVDGDLVQPLGSILSARTRGSRESLVRARLDFVEALCRSVEAL